MSPRQFYASALLALALNGSVLAASAINPNDLLGVWKEKTRDALGNTITYAFLKDHEFEFTHMYKDGSGGKKEGAWRMDRRTD